MKWSWRIAVCIVSAVSGTACVSPGTPTLKNLNDRDLVVSKQPLVKVDRQKVLQTYHAYLDSAPANHPMYNNALSRLADLEMLAADDKLFTEKEQQYQKALTTTPQAGDENGDENYRNAIELYEGLLKSNPRDRRNEWVLYKLARAYEAIGELEQALLTLSRLVKEYPNSEYLVEAQFRRGEISFSLGYFDESESALRYVVGLGRSTALYERALYKYAWAQFKQDRYTDALNSFFTLLDSLPVVYDLQEKIDTRALSQVEKDMLDDIFRAVSLCFSYAGGVKYIDKYFSQIKKPRYEYEVFVRLGRYFFEHDRVQDAADVYGVFVRRNPFHPMASSLQLERIAIYEKARFGRSALIAREEFVKQFGIGSEFWYRQNSSTKAILREQVKRTLNELSEFYHARWRKNHNREYFALAVKWYETYVKMFPQDATTAEKTFLLGELYTERKLYQKAVIAYENAAYKYPPHANSQKAAYALVDTYNRILKRQNTREWREKLVSASIRLLENYPEIKRADAIRARLVEDLFAFNRYDEAYQHAQILINKTNAARWVKVTAYIVAGHVSFDKNDYLQAQSYYNAALKLGIRNKRLHGEVKQKLAAAAYKHAEFLKAGGDLPGAAESFLALQKLAPGSEVTVKALYDSATAYFQLQDWPKSIRLLLDFRKKYPEHKLTPEVAKKLVVAYEATEQWGKAADELRLLASNSQDKKFRQDALWQAANYYEKAKQLKKAILAYKQYVRSYVSPFDQFIEGEQKLVELYAQTKQTRKRRYWLQQIVKQYQKNQKRFDDRGRYIAANAAFALATEQLAQYKRVSLKLPLRKSLRRKNALLKRTVRAFEKVTDIGVAEFVTASTYHVAEVYQELARAIMKSQRPRRLTPEELEEYNLLLEEQAYPFEEKAIEIYEANVARLQQGIYDGWIQKSLTNLAQLQPARYQKNEVHDAVYSALY